MTEFTQIWRASKVRATERLLGYESLNRCLILKARVERRGLEPKIMTERSVKAAADNSPLSFYRSGGIILEERKPTRRDWRAAAGNVCRANPD